MAKLLVVDDDAAITFGLKAAFESEGYEVTIERDGEAALSRARKGDYDCIVLDLMMPLMNGREVCRALRSEGVYSPIIFLTAKVDEADVVLGLEVGADDYVKKPFSVAELTARVRALIRRGELLRAKQLDTLSFGRVRIDFKSMQGFIDNIPIHLSVRELEVLRFLAEHEGSIVTREMLLDQIWGYDAFPTTRTVDNYILALRKKIEADPQSPVHIKTVHSKGYRFAREEVGS